MRLHERMHVEGEMGALVTGVGGSAGLTRERPAGLQAPGKRRPSRLMGGGEISSWVTPSPPGAFWDHWSHPWECGMGRLPPAPLGQPGPPPRAEEFHFDHICP